MEAITKHLEKKGFDWDGCFKEQIQQDINFSFCQQGKPDTFTALERLIFFLA